MFEFKKYFTLSPDLYQQKNPVQWIYSFRYLCRFQNIAGYFFICVISKIERKSINCDRFFHKNPDSCR